MREGENREKGLLGERVKERVKELKGKNIELHGTAVYNSFT